MIPKRLRFSGIRDYEAIEMNLGNSEEHVLITGPNGAGKSTLSFCMGAVLRSSKVEIEGLKSQNLREDETWRATIHFLFKNEGASRIDAPLYVEFRLTCEQLPKQPIKLQYEIYDGDTKEDLTLKQRYRSGDPHKNNFGAYRRELQIKYKIHPDLYYLIWYQQEVNQFSVMSPEERFRIFSEMHQISQIQKEWETSLEVVKEARTSFNEATIQQKSYEHDLDIARNRKERFEDNKRRLEEYGYLYAVATNGLKKKKAKERLDAERDIEEYKIELEELADEEQALVIDIEAAQQKKRTLLDQVEETEKKRTHTEANLKRKESRFTNITVEMESLQKQLSELQEAYVKLPYPEKETKHRWTTATEELIKLQAEEQAIIEQIQRTDEELEETHREQATVQSEIEHWAHQSEAAKEILRKYTSSYQLEKRIGELEDTLRRKRQLRDDLKGMQQQYETEITLLRNNQIESPRQQEAIRHLKAQQVEAYPLRYFIKVMDDVSIEKERLFDSIKYTIFYEGSTCQPLNDLYHVSLKKIIPTRSITALPQYGLTMRTDLSRKEQNNAARILWWIEQFFLKEAPYLKKGLLIDSRGMRGPQEKDTFILSKKAVMNRTKVLIEKEAMVAKEIDQLIEDIDHQNKTFRLWNADVHKVEEAEALLSKKVDQQYRLDQIEKIAERLLTLKKLKANFEREAQEIWKKTYEEKKEIDAREADLQVYEQFGQQSEKIDRLQQIEETYKTMKQEIRSLKRTFSAIQDQLDLLHTQVRDHNRYMESLNDEMTRNTQTKERHLERIQEEEESHVSITQAKKEYEDELETLRLLIPEIVEEAIVDDVTNESVFALQHRQSKAKAEFQIARNEKNIDPNAIENYFILEAEVQRKKADLHALKNLLEENEQRAVENERRLEVSITMHVQKINLLFGEYIGQFQFEGQIKYEKTMDKHDRPIFKLFIHVRKEGHRGKLVDVSLKARGGRVGKGVSGGEESLSSLLFALSLLQNLENQAGFIVLDEFDSALDDTRKAKVFKLYEEKLARKLIILSPKAHENDYYNKFNRAFIVSHDPVELKSIVRGLTIEGIPAN